MWLSKLATSPVLDVEHITSFDAFRSSKILGSGTSVPLNPRDFSIARASLAIPAGRIVLQRSFARHLEADMETPGAALVIPISPGMQADINARTLDNSTLALFRSNAPSRVVEPHANSYVLLGLHSAMRTRGWMDFERGVGFIRAAAPQMERLQRILLSMIRYASDCSDAKEFASLAKSMQETLLAALDGVLVQEESVRPRPRSFDQHCRLIARLDELIRENTAAPLYSDELARAVGTSVRTLQTATQAVHGMSLHQHLRLRRLWSTRCQLTIGLPGLTVQAVARANGFWHMGEFSRLYKATYGELPTETTARAARPIAGGSLPEDVFAVPSGLAAPVVPAWALPQHP
ncbi:MAG TPA: helix-turn-helix domain-containing protein [Bradyrhizobium sp.]|nr:helix-turn-helix domain-containing protein [Bradyrhizobium sp.]